MADNKDQNVSRTASIAESADSKEARRAEYISKVRESTREIADRVRRSEQLTSADYAVQINATEF